MPIIATATIQGRGRPLPLSGGGSGRGSSGTLRGTVQSTPAPTLTGHVSRALVESLAAPSTFYAVAVRLAGAWLPPAALVGPLEIDESLDTPARLFTVTITGRPYSIHHTETTWTAAPIEIWVTVAVLHPLSRSAGEGAGGWGRTWRRAFGQVLTCEQLEGPEPTLRIRCADPSRLYDRYELCYEFPADAGLTRGEICRQILTDAGFTTDIPAGALYTKPVITDSQKLWPFLQAFGEPESWSWRLPDWTTVEAYKATLKEHPEPPDDVWSLRDVLSIESTPPTDVPSQWVIRSTRTTETPDGLQITKQRTETFDFYAIKKAVALQQADGTHQPIASTSAEAFRKVSALETEIHERSGLTIAKITREWHWYNPRAAKLRTPSAGQPPGPVEGGYHYAQAFLDESGACRAWPQESFVQTAERRELPTYDPEGTETARRIETYRWYSRPMGVRNVGSSTPNVLDAGVGEEGLSWYPFERAQTALLRIEDYGLAQLDEITLTYGESGAVTQEVQETSTWYSERTPITGVPWFVNASGSGQKHLLAPFQRTSRKTTTNTLTADGLLAGTIETSQGFIAPRRVEGPFDYGDHRSNLEQETWRTTGRKTTLYNVLDENTYEEITDEGTGAVTRLAMGRAPRPRYRASPWTRLVQTPFEVILEDPTVAAWWGPSTEVLNLDYIQSPAEALSVAKRRRARRLAITHTVIRPICPTKPGDTIHLIDPRTGLNHRCLVTRLQERWSLTPRPQILATYTLEQPL